MLKLSELNIKKSLLVLASSLVIFLFGIFGLLEDVERSLGDILLNLKVKVDPFEVSQLIFPVDLSDRAEKNLEGKMEIREAFSNFFEFLGYVDSSGGLDFIFNKNMDPEIDTLMADNLSYLSKMVVAVTPIPKDLTEFSGESLSDHQNRALRRSLWYPQIDSLDSIPEASNFMLPYDLLLESSNILGHIGVEQDKDGIYRKTPMFFRWEEGLIPSLSLAIIAAEFDINPEDIVVKTGHYIELPLDKRVKIPIDSRGMATIPYPHRWRESWKRYPLDEAALANIDPELGEEYFNSLEGSIVIVSDISTGGKDFGTTPLETVYPLSGIHTSIINGILTNSFYYNIVRGYRILIFIIITLSVLLISFIKSNKRENLAFLILLLIYGIFSILLWFNFDTYPWLVIPTLGVVIPWLTTVGIKFYEDSKKTLLLESALSRYFPKALASRLLKERKVELLPSSKELTIMFSDISGFTSWSSDKSPKLVHSFLNEYLELMASIIFKNSGTVDKFMGDGILAFFGDPIDLKDHRACALNAALQMQEAVKDNCERWKDQYSVDLKVRVGINSGKVIVGNLGNNTRIEYTVIGASVNLAQRFESNAPLGGILVSEDTWKESTKGFDFREMDPIKAKGYDEPVPAYQLVGKRKV